jgi:hypothetical protein
MEGVENHGSPGAEPQEAPAAVVTAGHAHTEEESLGEYPLPSGCEWMAMRLRAGGGGRREGAAAMRAAAMLLSARQAMRAAGRGDSAEGRMR